MFSSADNDPGATAPVDWGEIGSASLSVDFSSFHFLLHKRQGLVGSRGCADPCRDVDQWEGFPGPSITDQFLSHQAGTRIYRNALDKSTINFTSCSERILSYLSTVTIISVAESAQVLV